MYYEVHGIGDPIVLLHGAYATAEGPMRKLMQGLNGRQVILVELQGHGRTADIDRPITYEQMADDVEGLIKFLKLKSADVFGYSMGAGVALQLVLRHPETVRKLVILSGSYSSKGVYDDLWRMIPSVTPEVFIGTPWKKEYDSLAPRPSDFPKLVEKLKALDSKPFDWDKNSIAAIKAPILIMIGDSDIVKPEHAVETFRLLGGGVMGDVSGLPKSQLAIIPGASHVTVLYQLQLLVPMIVAFLKTSG